MCLPAFCIVLANKLEPHLEQPGMCRRHRQYNTMAAKCRHQRDRRANDEASFRYSLVHSVADKWNKERL